MSSIKYLEMPATCRLCESSPCLSPSLHPGLWLWLWLSCIAVTMEWANETLVTEFVFLGFSSLAGLQRLLFAVFLLVYLFMLGTNVVIVSTIVLDRALHTPMYFFLGVLSCSETCYTFVIVPKMLGDLLAQKKTISFLGCAIQMFFFLSSFDFLYLNMYLRS